MTSPKQPVGSHDPENKECRWNWYVMKSASDELGDCACPENLQEGKCDCGAIPEKHAHKENGDFIHLKAENHNPNCAGCCRCPQPQATQERWEEEIEAFAAMEHTRWSKWQSYLHSLCTKNDDGSLTIPFASVIHWERQIGTPYSQLTEREKESDRNEVRPYTEMLRTAIETALKEERERIWNEASINGHLDGHNKLIVIDIDILKVIINTPR
jgi:hypothetical protein